jgi:nitrate/nitrite transporter NarK
MAQDDALTINDNTSNPVPRYNENDTAEPLIEKGNVGIRSTKLRWFVLALACLTNVGSFYSFDIPGALQNGMEDKLHIDDDAFAYVYSLYSLPNIILPFFGGIIVDKLGIRIALGVFSFILIIGQGIVTLGAYQLSYGVILAGRIVFGLGGECLSVAQSSVIAKWFMGKELSLALGASLCVGRLGSSANSVLSTSIYSWTNETLWIPFLVGLILCVVSWISGLILGGVDVKADKQEGVGKEGSGEGEAISLKDLKNFKLIYYLLLFNCFFLYGAFFGLNNNLNKIMQVRFGFTNQQAGFCIPIVYICSAVITPLFGKFTDAKGKRVFWMLLASSLFFIDHLVIAFLPDTTQGHPNWAMLAVLLGVGLFYATYAAIFWPCIPLVVRANMIGTAYGVVCSLQNLMLAIIPLALGAIAKGTSKVHAGYFWTEILLAVIVGIGIIITTWMYFLDIKTGGVLNKPGTSRAKSSAKMSSFSKH